jgi:hypothetical protein
MSNEIDRALTATCSGCRAAFVRCPDCDGEDRALTEARAEIVREQTNHRATDRALADLRQQLAAAQAALTAEREAHEQTRADLREERQRTWEYVAYAATLKDVCDDLEERDGQFKNLIEQALAAEREARSEQEALRIKAVDASAAADKNFASMLDAWAERDAAREALARLEGLARELVAVIQRGKPVWVDCAFDTDGMIVSVTIPHGAESALAAALPPTPTEPAPRVTAEDWATVRELRDQAEKASAGARAILPSLGLAPTPAKPTPTPEFDPPGCPQVRCLECSDTGYFCEEHRPCRCVRCEAARARGERGAGDPTPAEPTPCSWCVKGWLDGGLMCRTCHGTGKLSAP